MNSIRSNNLRLKYQRFTPSGCKDIGVKNLELVEKAKSKTIKNMFPILLCCMKTIQNKIKQFRLMTFEVRKLIPALLFDLF